ncbi:pyrophosphatase [Petrotoga sp. HKA.pet.4.5]|uniref:nucleoside triphosphate pyrophosphohydrolase n=1 Tax=unclassified Petrotoga TaxID=2620614 RepID=UPI000EF16D27|nr:pyrophosphatase [Petrotoga sp. Shatin.DS.tank11.9.2.9.3]RLL89416.1 pyrophosphatase [Petrotoga sp. HKA.pet.4.5]
MLELGEKFEELMTVMKRLRGPQGCDWDKVQTHESLKPYIIEEAYELVDSIDEKDITKIKEELGDILLQVVFHSTIAEESNEFSTIEVIDELINKLVRRHPHVFGDEKGYSYARWEEIKAKENGEKNFSRIGKLNKALPALSLARRIQENAAAVGFDWVEVKDVLDKVKEEVEELNEAKTQAEVEEEFGDLLFALVNLARFLSIDPEVSLRKASEKFIERFNRMEKAIEKDGKEFEALNLDELDKYWELIKKEEKR